MEIGKSLLETLKSISEIFSNADIQFCLVGGLALGIIAQPRATEDIDLLVLFSEEEREVLARIIRKNFQVIDIHAHVMLIGKSKIWRILLQDPYNREGIMIIDILFADHVIYQNAVKNSIRITVDTILITHHNFLRPPMTSIT